MRGKIKFTNEWLKQYDRDFTAVIEETRVVIVFDDRKYDTISFDFKRKIDESELEEVTCSILDNYFAKHTVTFYN